MSPLANQIDRGLTREHQGDEDNGLQWNELLGDKPAPVTLYPFTAPAVRPET